jgi:hypothetical protein
MVLKPVVVREPPPQQLPITIAVQYPDELRAVRQIELTLPGGFRLRRTALLGEASVKLFDEMLGLLFAEVRPAPLTESASRDVVAIVEPRVMQATLSTAPHRGGQIFTATIAYGITLYSVGGERLVSTTALGVGSVALGPFDAVLTRPAEARAIELAMRDAAWNFMRGFRDDPEIRSWLDRAVRVERR